MNCILCDRSMYPANTGEPWLRFNGKPICSDCYIDLIPAIYRKSGMGDGGIIHLVFKSLLTSSHNRKKRTPLPFYKKTLNILLAKYKFKCVHCGIDENLTIDHIKPVSKGGSDDFRNLQILCKPCNSRKGNR